MAEKQTHKDTIVIWHEAVQLFDQADRGRALANLQSIQEPSAKILYNIGHIQLTEGRIHDAVQTFKKSIEKDSHMGIAHFQLAQTYYQQQSYDWALQSLEKARNCLRGNKFIDYKQLGLQYKLYECEILHNLALAYAALNETESALDLMTEAARCKSETRHGVIDSALATLKNGRLPKPFAVPDEHIFQPPAQKVQNIKGIDYLGKAKVVSELVVPDSENKRGRSPSPLSPQHALPPAPTQPVPVPPRGLQPIHNPARSTFPNLKAPPLRPPPAAPGSSNWSSISLPPSRPPPSLLPSHLPSTSPSGTSPLPSPTLGAKATQKETISMWNESVLMFERGQVVPALDQMLRIVDPTAKILFDIGMLQLKMGNVNEADEVFQTVVNKDPHLAIGHFQHGNVQCQLNRPDQARRQYDKCLGCFRGHKFIDYKQLGLPYKLYEFEVLHNQAWAYYKLDQRDKCCQLLREAQGTKPETRHDAIDNSLKNAKAGAPFDIMKLPKRALFRPPKAKIDNLNKLDYLGKATVVSELNTGSDRSISPGPARPKENLPPRKSLPGTPPKSLLEPPRKSLPGPPSRVGNLTPPFLAMKSLGNGQNLPVPIPPRSTSLGLNAAQDMPLLSPALPSRPVPPVPIHASTDDSTIPRRTPPVPPIQNGHSTNHTNSDRSRKFNPAFDYNKPLPVLPDALDGDEPNYGNTPPTTVQRHGSPVPPSRPVPPSPNRSSPALGRRTPSGPPDKPVPPSPNRLSPGMPNRIPPSIPIEGSQEPKRRPVSPLPPKLPLPPPPVGAANTNKQSPGIAKKIIHEVQGKRETPGFNNNSQLQLDFWRENLEAKGDVSPSQLCGTSPTPPRRDTPSPTIYEVF